MSPKTRVLVVDDESEITTLLSEALQAAGCDVATAADGDEGLRQLAAFRPHAVILDVMMPGENGYRISRRIKSGEALLEGDAIPKVILLTGRCLEQFPEREEMFQQFSMADRVMYKPIDLPGFIADLQALLSAAPRPAPAATAPATIDS